MERKLELVENFGGKKVVTKRKIFVLTVITVKYQKKIIKKF